MWDYSEAVKEHYRNPRNSGMMEDANAIGYAGSLSCGDAITLFLKINDEGTVANAKFLGYGCASAIASASILTEIVIGKNIEELKEISNQNIVDALGGLPEPKIHCSVMCQEVLEYAICDYTKQKILPNEQITCQCFNLSEQFLKKYIEDHNLKNIDELIERTKIATACGRCEQSLEQFFTRLNV